MTADRVPLGEILAGGRGRFLLALLLGGGLYSTLTGGHVRPAGAVLVAYAVLLAVGVAAVWTAARRRSPIRTGTGQRGSSGIT